MAEYKRCGVYKNAIETQRATVSPRMENVLIEMLSGWHTYGLVLQDRIEANEEFILVKGIWLSDRLAEEQIQEYVRQGESFSAKVLNALRVDAITEDQFDAMVNTGAIQS